MKKITLMTLFLMLISISISGCESSTNENTLDAAKLDPKHYKVEFENDKVRVLRIKYPPGEKSVMHDHSEGVVVVLNDQKAKFTQPNGESFTGNAKAGTVFWSKATRHLPENIGSDTTDVIQIELKE